MNVVVLRPDRPASKGMLVNDGFGLCFAPTHWPANEATRTPQPFAPSAPPIPPPPHQPARPGFDGLLRDPYPTPPASEALNLMSFFGTAQRQPHPDLFRAPAPGPPLEAFQPAPPHVNHPSTLTAPPSLLFPPNPPPPHPQAYQLTTIGSSVGGIWPPSIAAPPTAFFPRPLFETSASPFSTGTSPSSGLSSPGSHPSPAERDSRSSRPASRGPTRGKVVGDENDEDLVPPPRTMNGHISHSHRVSSSWVKRPANAFLRFRSAFIAKNSLLPRGHPERLEESRTISCAAAICWKNLSEGEKDRFKAEARLALDEFKRRHPDDESTKRERARARKRPKQKRAHTAVDSEAAGRAARRAMGTPGSDFGFGRY